MAAFVVVSVESVSEIHAAARRDQQTHAGGSDDVSVLSVCRPQGVVEQTNAFQRNLGACRVGELQTLPFRHRLHADFNQRLRKRR